MRIEDLKKYTFTDDLVMRTMGKTVMVYNPLNGDMYEMNETAAILIDYLKQGYTGEQILDTVCREYDVDRETVSEDFAPLLTRLCEIGLLIIEE